MRPRPSFLPGTRAGARAAWLCSRSRSEGCGRSRGRGWPCCWKWGCARCCWVSSCECRGAGGPPSPERVARQEQKREGAFLGGRFPAPRLTGMPVGSLRLSFPLSPSSSPAALPGLRRSYVAFQGGLLHVVVAGNWPEPGCVSFAG